MEDIILTNLRCWVHRELKLGLFAIINREALHEERSKARASATTE